MRVVSKTQRARHRERCHTWPPSSPAEPRDARGSTCRRGRSPAAVAVHVDHADPAEIEGHADMAPFRVWSGEERRAVRRRLVRGTAFHDAALRVAEAAAHHRRVREVIDRHGCTGCRPVDCGLGVDAPAVFEASAAAVADEPGSARGGQPRGEAEERERAARHRTWQHRASASQHTRSDVGRPEEVQPGPAAISSTASCIAPPHVVRHDPSWTSGEPSIWVMVPPASRTIGWRGR